VHFFSEVGRLAYADRARYLGDPDFVSVPVARLLAPAYLASRACELTHQNYAAVAGRFARIFVGYGEGWLAERGASIGRGPMS